MVSYCNSTRRICVGAKNGGVAFYELKQSKCQVIETSRSSFHIQYCQTVTETKYISCYRIPIWMYIQVLPAHKGAVTAVAFSPDGKFLASYGINDNKLCFWQVGYFDNLQ